MSARGRPFRFVGLVCVGWIGVRIALLWPQTGSLPNAIRALVPLAATPSAELPAMAVALGLPARPPRRISARRFRPRWPLNPSPPLHAGPFAPPIPLPGFQPLEEFALAPAPPALPLPPPPSPRTNRWSASGWFVARGGSGTGAAPAGQLGGGQAGVRVAYLLAARPRIAIFGRVSAPLAGKGREAAAGVEWQPGQAPIRLAVERRVAIDGGPSGIGAGIAAGLYREARGFRIEGYVQAGAVARGRVDPYADGGIRVARTAAYPLSLGIGAWGGVQRGAERLDIGPSATLTLGRLRLSLDWRQRVAGRARPGSGLALTLGGDF
ncbi:hypothetical protein [Sphingomonas soli]|uniref:hypothetical protein n=1 Tax=Sphingomonas soli TaxID=266127 RepID=UPI00083747D1|nr:hypothetical protein [Sphingomonas soli]